jgi:hypothetical protein
MTADDSAVLSVLFSSPWERELREAARTDTWESSALGALVEARAFCAGVAVTAALWQHHAVPQYTPDEVSEAFDEILYERTIRIEADLVWRLGK